MINIRGFYLYITFKLYFKNAVVEDFILGWLDFTTTKILVFQKVVCVYYYLNNKFKACIVVSEIQFLLTKLE